MKKTLLTMVAGLALGSGSIYAQCSFTGLDTIYCANDSAATMIQSGTMGTFSGPGVTDSIFDPMTAGAGMHTVTYTDPDPNYYTIDQTGTFAPISSPITGTQVNLGDDQTSGQLPIGFTFTFFGTDYTDFNISSNGMLGFTAGMPNGCCTGGTIPTAGGPENMIAFAWEDLDPGNGGQPAQNFVQYVTMGTAPNQVLVMEFYNVDHFSAGNQVTTQVHLYETSNIIEIHTINMPSDGGAHTMGIENVDGSIGFAVPGRNADGSWSVSNDYVAFIPGCVVSQNVEVIALPMVVGTVDFNSICPGDSVVFTGSGADSTMMWDNGVMDGVAYAPAASGDFILTGWDSTGCYNTDTVSVVVNTPASVTLTGTDEMIGADATITTVATGSGPFTYDWDNDGTGDFDDTADLTGLTAGTYTVVIMDANGCITTDSVTVGSQVGLEDLSGVSFSIYPNPTTGEFQVNFESISDDLSFEIINSLGQVILSEQITSNILNVDIRGNESGVYFVKVISNEGTTVRTIVLQ